MRAEIEIKNLDHLGLVAGLIDELEIESIVNEAVGIDRFKKVTAGQIVKGIIINGLDFISKPLYLFPQFFANKPVEELREQVKAEEQINYLTKASIGYGIEKRVGKRQK
jgi:transposase